MNLDDSLFLGVLVLKLIITVCSCTVALFERRAVLNDSGWKVFVPEIIHK